MLGCVFFQAALLWLGDRKVKEEKTEESDRELRPSSVLPENPQWRREAYS